MECILEVKNIGYYTAKEIKLSFKNDFLTVIGSGLVESSKKSLDLAYDYVQSNGFNLNGGDYEHLFIGKKSDALREKLSKINVFISGHYTDTYTSKNIKICEEFIGTAFVCAAGIQKE